MTDNNVLAIERIKPILKLIALFNRFKVTDHIVSKVKESDFPFIINK